MGYYTTLIFYTEVPREALPAHLNDLEKPIFQILIDNGLGVYPGRFSDYDNTDNDKPLFFNVGDKDHTNPRVNLSLIWDIWDDTDIPKWTYADIFCKNTAIFTEMHIMECYKFGSTGDSGDTTVMRRHLLELGIDVSNVTMGWQMIGRAK